MRLLFRFLSFLGIPGCGYWIYTNHFETEPRVALVAALAAFVGTFIGAPKANIVPSLTLNGNNGNFRIHNIGSADAYSVTVTFHGYSPFHQQDLDAFPKDIAAGEHYQALVPLAFDLPSKFEVTLSWRGEGDLFRTTRKRTVSLQS